MLHLIDGYFLRRVDYSCFVNSCLEYHPNVLHALKPKSAHTYRLCRHLVSLERS